MVERTLRKRHAKPEGVGMLKMQSPHPALGKRNIPKTGPAQLDQAKITMAKFAVNKQDTAQINTRKVAMHELAIFIFPLFQGPFPEIFLLESQIDKQLRHPTKISIILVGPTSK
jgi:hypothetical protein